MSNVSKSILKGAAEALAYAKGQKKNARTHKVKVHVPKNIDVQAVRKHLHMTRAEFSDNFGFSMRTLEKWERHERQPESSARAYLMVIHKNPHAVQKALQRMRWKRTN